MGNRRSQWLPRKKERKEERCPPSLLPPPSLLFHPKCFCICVSLCWRRVSPRKGELTAPLKPASPHCWEKKISNNKVCGGKHSPPAGIFVFLAFPCVIVHGALRVMCELVAAVRRGFGLMQQHSGRVLLEAGGCAGWLLLRLRQVFWFFVSCYFMFCRCCVLIMKATQAVDQMTSR